MRSLELLSDEKSTFAPVVSTRGAGCCVQSTELARVGSFTIASWSAEGGADLRELVVGKGTCALALPLRGCAVAEADPCPLVADPVTAALLTDRFGPPVRVLCAASGLCVLGSVTDFEAAGGATGRHWRPACASVTTSPGDHLTATLLSHAYRCEPGAGAARYEPAVLGLVASIMRELASLADDDRRDGPGYQRQLSRVRAALARSLDRSISLRTLAREVDWSPWYLSRRFSMEVGLPVHRYLTRARLRVAVDRVVTTSQGLASIAQDVGFSSHSHFTSAFRVEFGITPWSLRQLAGAQDSADLAAFLPARAADASA